MIDSLGMFAQALDLDDQHRFGIRRKPDRRAASTASMAVGP